MFIIFLLSTNPSTLFSIFQELLPYIGFLFSAWVYWKNQDKEATKNAQEELKKVKSEVANHGLMFTAFQQEREHLVDKYNARLDVLESRVSQVDQVLSKVQQLETKLEVQNGIINELKNGVNRIECDIKEHNKEIIELIKTIRK